MRERNSIDSGNKLPLAVLALALLAFIEVASAAEFADPTRPTYVQSDDAAQAANVRKKYRLSSILVGEQRKLAVINGQRVREGDRVGSAKVKRISKSSVTLLIQDAAVNIALSAHDIKNQ